MARAPSDTFFVLFPFFLFRKKYLKINNQIIVRYLGRFFFFFFILVDKTVISHL